MLIMSMNNNMPFVITTLFISGLVILYSFIYILKYQHITCPVLKAGSYQRSDTAAKLQQTIFDEVLFRSVITDLLVA